MTPFQSWTLSEFSRMAAWYRSRLQNSIDLVTHYCETVGGSLNQPQYEMMVETLNSEPVPRLGKYPDQTTEADRAWYATVRRPEWGMIKMEYLDKLKLLRQ